MAGGNPGLVIRLCSARDGRTIRANDRDLVGRVNHFPTCSALLGPLAAFPTPALLREKRRYPCRVDKVTRAYERGGEEKVEENTMVLLA